MSALASLNFLEQRSKKPVGNHARTDFALDTKSQAKDLLYGGASRLKEPDFAVSGRRRLEPPSNSHLPALPSATAPWGQSDGNLRRGRATGAGAKDEDAKGPAPWDKDAGFNTSAKKAMNPILKQDRQGRGRAGVPWGDDTVPKPALRETSSKAPYYTEDSLSKLLEVAKHDPAMQQRAPAKAPEAYPSQVYEVWEKGECVHLADNREAADKWAKAHRIVQPDVRPISLQLGGSPKPILLRSPKGEDAGLSRSAKSLSQVTFNPTVTYSQTPRESTEDAPKKINPTGSAKFGRRALG